MVHTHTVHRQTPHAYTQTEHKEEDTYTHPHTGTDTHAHKEEDTYTHTHTGTDTHVHKETDTG